MVITVRVKPGSKKAEIIKENETNLIVRVRERAVDCRANEAVIAALAAYFDCPKSCIGIHSGHSSRLKKIVIGK